MLNAAAKNAMKVAKGAAGTLNTAGNAAGNVVGGVAKDVSKTVGSAVSSAVEGASAAGEVIVSSQVGKAAGLITNSIGSAGSVALDTVGSAASEAVQTAQKTVSDIVSTIKENSPSARLKRERINGMRDGIDQGIYLAAQDRYNFYYAYVSTLCFFLRCDGVLSDEEEAWLASNLNHLKLEGGLPEDVKEKLKIIAGNESISFYQVKEHLDRVSLRSLDSIGEHVQLSIELDEEVSDEEKKAQELFSNYVSLRSEAICEIASNPIQEAVEDSIKEYETNYDRINNEFKEKTKLQDSDLAFLIAAILLQTMRVLVINAITEVEAAGSRNRNERVLHDFQDKLLKGFNDSSNNQSRLLYASTQHIVTSTGVPYDITAGGQGLFEGANHRFSTLGHDPLLGLIFGTSNIMTNSITCVKDAGIGIKLPLTFPVSYEGPRPLIAKVPVSTAYMLTQSGKRILDEPKAACAALIKQLLHIGTDLYTIAGIQIPLSGIILDKAHVEKLTHYISTGDVIKIGAQAGFATFINWLIAALHGCSLVFKNDGSSYSEELHQARTKKIILISDTFATSSSVLQTAITKNPKCLDLGGAVVLAARLFSDMNFISSLKEEYINSGLSGIYEQRAKEVLR